MSGNNVLICLFGKNGFVELKTFSKFICNLVCFLRSEFQFDGQVISKVIHAQNLLTKRFVVFLNLTDAFFCFDLLTAFIFISLAFCYFTTVSYDVDDFRTRYLLEWYLIDWDLLVWYIKVRYLLSCNL